MCKQKWEQEPAEKTWAFTTQSGVLMTLEKQPFENIVGKGGNTGDQYFLLFPKCFVVYQGGIPLFQPYLNLSQTRNFRHFQIERACRRQFKI